MTDRKLKQEAEAFDQQIIERVRHGHLPDLRRSGRCEYFFNNVWRDQEFAALYFGEIVQKVLAARVAHLPGKAPGETTLLEVGCGPGQVSLELARNGLNVTGLDLSAACIDVATKVAAEDPWAGERGELQYEAADFFAYDQPCDIVLFAASLHHFPDCRQPVAHAASLLPAGGLVIVDEPARDLVSRKNCAVIALLKGLLAGAGAYYEDVDLPDTERSAEEWVEKILLEEKYELADGTKQQSVHDNESGFEEMYAALCACLEQVEFKKDYAFFHQLIGGVRLADVGSEHRLARFMKVMDSLLCRLGAVDATNFYFVGRKA